MYEAQTMAMNKKAGEMRIEFKTDLDLRRILRIFNVFLEFEKLTVSRNLKFLNKFTTNNRFF